MECTVDFDIDPIASMLEYSSARDHVTMDVNKYITINKNYAAIEK